MTKSEIPVFENNNALLEAIGFPHRSHISYFDIYAIENMGTSTRRYMPPYRQNFYQIGLLSHVGDIQLDIDTERLSMDRYPLWFVVPGQVFSWVRDETVAGYNIIFKKEFLSQIASNFLEEFPFLRMSDSRVLMLTKEERDVLLMDAQRIKSVFESPHPYQEKMLEGMLGSLLYFCKAIYERHRTKDNHLSRSQIIANKFEVLVDKMYLNTKNVGDYAAELNITPNYLTTTIRKLMGKSAKDMIKERLFIERKSLLKYSDLDIAEIAYRLNFKEPTHFTRFFRNMSGVTPNQFRKL